MVFHGGTKGVEIAKFVPGHYVYLLSYFYLCTYCFNSVLWGRLHFATYVCYINYKSICYAHFPILYYSQFTVKIIFENSVTGYIPLLCMTIT